MARKRKLSEDATGTGQTKSAASTKATLRKRHQTAHAFDPNNQRITRSIATQVKVAARDAVFSTPELVENILTFLPAKNIFGVMRVSKSQFKAVIDSSSDLKRKMFIRSGREGAAQSLSSAGAYQDMSRASSKARAVKMEDLLPVSLNPMLEGRLHTWYARKLSAANFQFHDETLDFVLENYAPRNPKTGEFVAQNLTFLDAYLTDPPCPRMEVVLIINYDVPASTDVSPSGKQTFTVRTDWYQHDPRTGPTIRDIMTAMSQLRLKYRRPGFSRHLPHKNRRYWDCQLPEALPSNASLDQTLTFLGAGDKAHAAGIANRRTTVQVKMPDTLVYRPQGLLVWSPPQENLSDS